MCMLQAYSNTSYPYFVCYHILKVAHTAHLILSKPRKQIKERVESNCSLTQNIGSYRKLSLACLQL